MVRTLLAASALVALAGCSRHSEDGTYFGTIDRGPKEATTLYANNGSEPEYIDPGLSSESTGATIVRQLFEGLLIKHPETVEPIQGVATHYDASDDNRLFRFHLRPEEKWSDGRPVVADDFIYAWRRVLDPATGARPAELMYVFKNGKAFNQGKIKRLARDEPLRTSATTSGETVTARTPVTVLATSPSTTRLRPLSATVDAALDLEGAALRGARAEALAEPTEVAIVAVGPAVVCNHEDDRWYRVRGASGEGWLPGCALTPKKTDDSLAVISTAATAPSFSEEVKTAPPERVGFLPLTALVGDPDVIGVRARGDHVIEIELERPTPHFLEILAYTAFSPVRRDVIEHWAAAGQPERWFRPENIVSNGPYVLASHQFRYQMELTRNPHHYDHDALKLHRVVLLAVDSYHATMNLYKAGEIDFIGENLSLPQTYLDLLEGFGDFHRAWWIGTYWYEINTTKPPVDDARVRRALNLAIDKRQLIDRVTRAGQAPATHYVPDFAGSGYADEVEREKAAGGVRFAGPGHDFDPERGRALLREAGYQVVKDGERYRVPGFPDLEILYNTAEGHRTIAVAIQDMWKRHLGIHVQLRNEEWKVFLKNLRDGNFQIARFGWIGDYNHPHSWLETFTGHSHNNWTGHSDPSFDALLAEAARTSDRAASMALYRDAEAKMVASMPRIPIYFYTKSTLIKPYVKGYWSNVANEHPFRNMWIDPDFKAGRPNVSAVPIRPLPAPGAF
jgi:oligopeptide transport system substrate-binding protein